MTTTTTAIDDDAVHQEEAVGRVQHLSCDRIAKDRLKMRTGISEEDRDAIDHAFECKPTSPAFLPDDERFSAEPFVEAERRAHELSLARTGDLYAARRSRRLNAERERIERLEADQIAKLSAMMLRPSGTASSVAYDILSHDRFPGIYGDLLQQQESARRDREAARRRRCDEQSNGEYNVLTWTKRSARREE